MIFASWLAEPPSDRADIDTCGYQLRRTEVPEIVKPHSSNPQCFAQPDESTRDGVRSKRATTVHLVKEDEGLGMKLDFGLSGHLKTLSRWRRSR